MGSIWQRLKFVWITLASILPLVALFYVLPASARWFDGLLVKAASTWFLLSIAYSFFLLVTFRPATTARSAWTVIKEISQGQSEYCLLLRPFGSDGYVPLRKWYPPNSARAVLFRAVAVSRTLEQVLEAAVRQELKCQTLALIDPSLRTVPRSPRYIAADNASWRVVVDTLLRRALFTVLILPPGQHAREALRWELTRAIEIGLIGRLLIILPPPDLRGAADAYDTLRDLQDLFPSINLIEPNVILIYPHSYEQLEWFKPTGRDLFDKTYQDGIAEILSSIHASVKGLTFAQRYPYFDGNLVDISQEVQKRDAKRQ